jgi:hypothetical protein
VGKGVLACQNIVHRPKMNQNFGYDQNVGRVAFDHNPNMSWDDIAHLGKTYWSFYPSSCLKLLLETHIKICRIWKRPCQEINSFSLRSKINFCQKSASKFDQVNNNKKYNLVKTYSVLKWLVIDTYLQLQTLNLFCWQVMSLFAAALLEKQIVIVCSNLVLIRASQCSGLLNSVLYLYYTH